jgi:hypothetical protein
MSQHNTTHTNGQDNTDDEDTENMIPNNDASVRAFFDRMVESITSVINTESLLSRNSLIALMSILIVIIGIIIFKRPPITCDMTLAENRDFDSFYGISGMKNHFTAPTADGCDSNIIFRPALPQSVLKADNSASSFMTLAKYGTGKTLLRCEYFQSLNSNDYLKVLVLNKETSEYLERYAAAMAHNVTDCKDGNCLIGWSDHEFAQLLLSAFVTDFIRKFHDARLYFPELSLDERIDLITIVCYYYNGIGTAELENFVNYFLNKKTTSMYRASQAQTQTLERNIHYDKPLLIHLKDDLKKFIILKNEPERLHLLLAILEGEEYQNQAGRKSLYGNVFKDLIRFTSFIKKYLKKTTIFIIDGIDENRYFFQKNDVNKVALELFCRSSISQEILSIVMAQHFHLSLFYPKIDGIDFQDAINRKDKFPTHTITWNSKSLSNYADYVLQHMNKNANKTRCKPFTNFKTLVNSSNRKIAEIIEKIPTPRALHYFMSALIREMNNEANSVKEPFIATFENVHAAYEESYENFHKRHKINE